MRRHQLRASQAFGGQYFAEGENVIACKSEERGAGEKLRVAAFRRLPVIRRTGVRPCPSCDMGMAALFRCSRYPRPVGKLKKYLRPNSTLTREARAQTHLSHLLTLLGTLLSVTASRSNAGSMSKVLADAPVASGARCSSLLTYVIGKSAAVGIMSS